MYKMECVLCKHRGEDCDQVFQVIHDFIYSNSGLMHEKEIAKQVSDLLKNEVDIDMSVQEVRIHMHKHITDQKIVLDKLLRDLLDISALTKRSSVIDAEAGQQVDSKMLMLHLKTVDQITTIYRIRDNRRS